MRSVNVRSKAGHPYAMEINAGGHVFIADEDTAAGGEGLGPVPYELLLSGIGACTAITLLMYARRKEWPVEDVNVELSHEKVHPSACLDSTEEERNAGPTARVDLFRIQVSVKGDLSQEQLDRLLEIADRCPVHRTIESKPRFTSSITQLV
jgi:putative redox protein